MQAMGLWKYAILHLTQLARGNIFLYYILIITYEFSACHSLRDKGIILKIVGRLVRECAL